MAETSELKKYLKSLKDLNALIGKENPKNGQIQKRTILDQVEDISQKWFDEIKPVILTAGIEVNEIAQYDKDFAHLLKLSSSSGNRKDSFVADFKNILKKFNDEIILRISTGSQLSATPLAGAYETLLKGITDQEQSSYLREAINCAKSGFLKAAIVLGWCSAINQIHRTIEKVGFVSFNVASAQMASATSGRFKKYNKVRNINSYDDLKEVFDNDILWIIEGMGLIDPNQHTRLKSCFDMRNHSAHPGEAPITTYNVMSFFSDINEIVLKNPKFNL